jgi:hypothetical protein
VALRGGLSLPANANWEQVPAALPVIIFTLVFHDIAPGNNPTPDPACRRNRSELLVLAYHLEEGQGTEPPLIFAVICAYLEGDLARIRLAILVGSLVPLVSLLVWDDIALGLATDLGGFDVQDMLKTE